MPYDISVIIPIAPDEDINIDTSIFPKNFEVITCDQFDLEGRAKQMNAGAKIAKGKYLWFLHSDSTINKDNFSALQNTIKKHPGDLLYFDLKFDEAGLMSLNELGVYFRSHVLKKPFGDQGFCMRKEIFKILGGYNEELSYGEDHVLVIRARQRKIKITSINENLLTSARKYQKNGWLKTTMLHQCLWLKQYFKEKSKIGAVAVFAKTPSLSPVKTRLAKDIGQEKALQFYNLSLAATEEVVRNTKNIIPYWALAEKKAVNLDRWQNFNTIWTGRGELGSRLHNIYSKLIKKHDYVILIGTDSPQLTPDLLESIKEKLQQHDFVIGPTKDGGFYLFAGKIPIKKSVWTSVRYSNENTLNELKQSLNNYELLDIKTDVDHGSDLKALAKELGNNALLETQSKVKDFINI